MKPVVNFLAVDAQLERKKRDLGLGPIKVELVLSLEALSLLISKAVPICALCFPLHLCTAVLDATSRLLVLDCSRGDGFYRILRRLLFLHLQLPEHDFRWMHVIAVLTTDRRS